MRGRQAVLLSTVLIMAACAASGAGDPARTVEKYIQAKVKGDATMMRGLLCSQMEAQLQQEANTFTGVAGVNIEGMACQQDGESTVRCQGKIVALYGKENMEFPLVAYRVVKEDGEWKWCGETQ
jgi:hypothetical protein